VARADRRRATRASAPDRPRASEYALIEDQLFFSRLRRHAKIGFVFLALVFGVGFVAFGVGSDVPGGIADVIQGSGSTGNISVGDAQEKVDENPSDANALRQLATALQQEGRSDEAIPPLEQYTRLRPKDNTALGELASLYVGKASRLRNRVAQVQAETQIVVPPADFLPPTTSPLGRALANQPISQAAQQRADARLATLYQDLQVAYLQAQQAYAKLAQRSPEDASVQLQLADASINANDPAAALAAYRRFLELAPDDPNAPIVRQTIRQLERGS
jgi:tetratricopeptide (TPR) repeat protein